MQYSVNYYAGLKREYQQGCEVYRLGHPELHPSNSSQMWFAHTGKIVRRDIFPSSSSTPHFFWDIFLWSTAQNHNDDSFRNELKELRKVGQKASKISCRKPFVAPNQSERVLMRAFADSGGLSGGGVTNRELCSQDDEQRWPVPQLSL